MSGLRWSLRLIAVVMPMLPPAAAQEQVNFANGQVAFLLPPKFRAMTGEEIKRTLPRIDDNSGRYAYWNEQKNVLIVVRFLNWPLAPHKLPDLIKVFEERIAKQTTGVKEIKHEIVQFNGRPWMHFEVTSAGVNTEVHNDMYLTSFGGKTVGFNFSAAKAQQARYKETLDWSRDTIHIQP